MGRLTRNAEIGQTRGGKQIPTTHFTMAVDREYQIDGETPTDFWPVEVPSEYGVRLVSHLTKGRLVLVSGTAYRDWNKDGTEQLFVYVNAQRVRLLDRPN